MRRVPTASDRLRLGAAALLLALGVLGALQYRWLRQIADAQRTRMRADAAAQAEAIAQEFDREVTHAFLMLPLDAATVASRDATAYATRYEAFRRASRWPSLVRDVYVRPRPEAGGAPSLLRFSPEERRLVPSAWPPELEPVRQRLAGGHEPAAAPAVMPEVPVLVVPVAERIALAEATVARPDAAATALRHLVLRRTHGPAGAVTMVVLDRAVLTGEVLPAIVARRLAAEGAYEASVVDARTGAHLFGTAAAGEGDARADLFRVRLEELDSALLRSLVPQGLPLGGPDRVNVRVVEAAQSAGAPPGRWRLVLRHRLGSVERAVQGALARNLAVGFSVLAVLGGSVVLIAASARRARALADRQMEFVAAVSHELRTPLAVIRSAGENLADGVVSEPAQVQRYGGLVRDEGERLSEMVEQVLSFAGAHALTGHPGAVDVGPVVDRVLASVGASAARPIERDFAAGLPPALADPAALERAVANLVGNAVKHAGAAAMGVRLSARPLERPGQVAITVWDRGPGIDPQERARLFEPFFRGRRARDLQVPGSGLGLAVVRRIAEGLGGRVEVESEAGEGAAFTLVLPAAPAVADAASADAQAHPAR
jgi:signal transduction histidine kinase